MCGCRRLVECVVSKACRVCVSTACRVCGCQRLVECVHIEGM